MACYHADGYGPVIAFMADVLTGGRTYGRKTGVSLLGTIAPFSLRKGKFINVQDEPAVKATFQVEITADKAMTVLSNMDVHSEKDLDHGKKTVLFNPTPKMSTYVPSSSTSFSRKKN